MNVSKVFTFDERKWSNLSVRIYDLEDEVRTYFGRFRESIDKDKTCRNFCKKLMEVDCLVCGLYDNVHHAYVAECDAIYKQILEDAIAKVDKLENEFKTIRNKIMSEEEEP